MEVTMTIKVEYDPEKDGNLAKFREKYIGMKRHVEHLQAKGTLPRCEIKWMSHIKKGTPPEDPTPVLPFVRPVLRQIPAIVHLQGQRLDPARIAV